MNRVLEVGRRARRETRRAERQRRGRPPRRLAPGPRPSGRLRDSWPSADQHRPTPPVTVRVLGARAGSASLADRATRSAADRVAPHPPLASPVTRRRSTVGDQTPPEPAAPPTLDPLPEPAAAPTPAPVPEPAAPPTPAPVPERAAAPDPVTPVIEAAPAAPTPETAPLAEVTRPPGATGPRRGRGRSWALAAAVAVVLVGGGAAVVAVNGDDTDRPVATAAAGSASDVATWLRANVASTATVAGVDAAVQRDLVAGGVDATLVASPDDLPNGGFLVAAPARLDSTSPTAVAGGRSLVPVARFVTGSATLQVAQVVDRGPDVVTDAAAAERNTATAATAGLLTNAALTVGPAARPAFEAGTLDLRAAAFLALLAGSTPTQVVQVRADAAERAAGLTDRRVVVVVVDPAVLRDAATGARYPFAPATAPTNDPDLPAGSVTLTWPVLADPTTVVS